MNLKIVINLIHDMDMKAISHRGYQEYKSTGLVKIQYLNFIVIGDTN